MAVTGRADPRGKLTGMSPLDIVVIVAFALGVVALVHVMTPLAGRRDRG